MGIQTVPPLVLLYVPPALAQQILQLQLSEDGAGNDVWLSHTCLLASA